MRMKIWYDRTNELASSLFLNANASKTINIFKEKKVKILDGEYYQYYSTPLFSIVRLNSCVKKTSEVMCEFEGKGIIMSFQEKGKISCLLNQQKRSMHEKQNNIFFHSGLVRCKLTEAVSFRIILSKLYVNTLKRLYPEAMAPLFEAYEECKNCVSDHSHLNTTLEMKQIIKNIEKLYLLQEDGKEMIIEAKIRELLYIQIKQHLSKHDKKDLKIEKYRDQMRTACEYIESNMQKLPSLRNIAITVGVCDTTLKIAFKYFYDKTVFEYLNEYRLNKACEFLQNPSYNISEVAFLTGYKHASHFSTVFKQKYGITPIRFRTKM